MTDNMTRKQVAEMLGVSSSAIRLYEREFSEWVASEKGTYGRSQAREYTPEDVNLFRFIRTQAKAGKDFDEIRQILQAEGVPQFAEIYEPETPPEGTAGQLVPLNQYMAAVAKMAATEGALNATTNEVEHLRRKVDDLERQVVDAERRAAAAEAMAGNKQSWWQRTFGRTSTPPAEGGDTSP